MRSRSVKLGLSPVGALVLAGVLVGYAALATEGAAAESAYSATASSAALRMDVRDPKVVPVLEGGGTESTSPSAQATADSLGQSRAVAAAVNPGSDASGATDIPLTVVADSGHPRPATMDSGGYQLEASAPAGEAHASANGGLAAATAPAASVTATADVAPTRSGGVSALASSKVTGLELMSVLKLGTVTARATAERTKNGVLKRSSSFTLTGASLLGLPLELVNGTLVVPVLGTQVSVAQAISSSPALAAVKERGLTLSFQSERRTPNGVVSPGIEISMTTDTPAVPIPTVPLPDPVPVSVGALPPSTAVTVLDVGFARASSDLQPIPDFGTVGSTPVAADPSSVGNVPDAPSVPGTGVAPAINVPGALPPVTSGTESVTPPALATTGARAPVAAASRVLVLPFRGADVYLVIVAGALVAFAAGQLIRYQGVRTA